MIRINNLQIYGNTVVSCDITAPLYWWLEFEKYSRIVTTTGNSLEHDLCNRPLSVHDFSFEDMHDSEFIVDIVLDNLNARIKDYKEGMKQNRGLWRTIMQLLPQSYNRTKHITVSRHALRSICLAQGRNPLSEWQGFYQYMHDNLACTK